MLLTILFIYLIYCNRAYLIEHFLSVKMFWNKDAHQAIAVSKNYFYAISNKSISKCDKITGKVVKRYKSDDSNMHLNSGTIIGSQLFCANNPKNFNSIVVFSKNLRIIKSFDIDIKNGSLTWIDINDGKWFGMVAFYKNQVHKTHLVQFNIANNKLIIKKKWFFPTSVTKRFYPYSCSGGSFKDNFLYCTGHDKKEIYVMSVVPNKQLLKHVKTIKSYSTGQGIDFDGNYLYGIHRKKKLVIAQLLK